MSHVEQQSYYVMAVTTCTCNTGTFSSNALVLQLNKYFQNMGRLIFSHGSKAFTSNFGFLWQQNIYNICKYLNLFPRKNSKQQITAAYLHCSPWGRRHGRPGLVFFSKSRKRRLVNRQGKKSSKSSRSPIFIKRTHKVALPHYSFQDGGRNACVLA